jgi:uncharacterized protein (DUF58 family)
MVRLWEPSGRATRDVAVVVHPGPDPRDDHGRAAVEHLVSEAASAALACLAAGDRVVVATPGTGGTLLTTSCPDEDTVLCALAAVGPTAMSVQGLMDALAAQLERGDLVVLAIAGESDAHSAARAGLEPLVRSRGAELVVLSAPPVQTAPRA